MGNIELNYSAKLFTSEGEIGKEQSGTIKSQSNSSERD